MKFRIKASISKLNNPVWVVEYRHWFWGWEQYEPIGWHSYEDAQKRIEQIKNG